MKLVGVCEPAHPGQLQFLVNVSSNRQQKSSVGLIKLNPWDSRNYPFGHGADFQSFLQTLMQGSSAQVLARSCQKSKKLLACSSLWSHRKPGVLMFFTLDFQSFPFLVNPPNNHSLSLGLCPPFLPLICSWPRTLDDSDFSNSPALHGVAPTDSAAIPQHSLHCLEHCLHEAFCLREQHQPSWSPNQRHFTLIEFFKFPLLSVRGTLQSPFPRVMPKAESHKEVSYAFVFSFAMES